MKILITGAAGFIGSNMVKFLRQKGYQIVVVDILNYASGFSWENISDLKVTKIKGDVRKKKDCAKAVRNCQAVIHFAAESHVTRSEKQRQLFYDVNVKGTENMILAAKKAGVSKFIHISTDEVYGPIKKGLFNEEDKQIGDHQATSPYAKSKSLADDLAIKAKEKFDYPVIVVRMTNNYGPYQYPEKALPRWITRLLSGENIPVWGKGDQVRDWLFVEDCCRGIYLILKKGKPGQAYNIGANNRPEITNKKIAELLVKTMRLNQDRIEFIPDPRPQHDYRYGVDTKKIEKLGWKPKIKIDQGIKKTVSWYKKNEPWWQGRLVEAESIYKQEQIKKDPGVVIIGSRGQLGRAFSDLLKQEKIRFSGYDLPEFDASDIGQVRELFKKIKPEIIINCAAATDVNGCERDKKYARKGNIEIPKNLAREARKNQTYLIHFSTDYVFSGSSKRPYSERSKPNPVNIYGKTKLAGEKAVKDSGCHYLLVRTSWLFGEGKNFIKSIIKKAREGKPFFVVNDQWSSPTYAADLAKASWYLIEKKINGLVHLSNSDETSWFDLAREALKISGINPKLISPISSNQWDKMFPGAKRPVYSKLISKRVKLNIKMPSWKSAVRRYLGE